MHNLEYLKVFYQFRKFILSNIFSILLQISIQNITRKVIRRLYVEAISRSIFTFLILNNLEQN